MKNKVKAKRIKRKVVRNKEKKKKRRTIKVEGSVIKKCDTVYIWK